MSLIPLRVNGVLNEVELPPETPLLPVLRQELGLKGTRFGCGEERCGACTILIDGRPLHSCTMQLSDVAGKNITTIEGLWENENTSVVPRMFIEEQAAQCGYCINGIVMSLSGLLARRPRPNRDELLAFLDERHLCRCGSHPRILRAIDRLLESPEVAE